MRVFRLVVQALLGLLLCAAAALAASAWLFPAGGQELAQIAGFRLNLMGAGVGMALLTVLLFANGWLGARSRQADARSRRFAAAPAEGGGADAPARNRPGFAGLLAGLGFGLLPAIAVFECFAQHSFLAAGREVPETLPALAWFTAEGCFQPCRVEAALALLCFGGLVLWLMLRKTSLQRQEDLLPLSLALFGAALLFSLAFRPLEGTDPARWGAAGVMLLSLLFFLARSFRQKKNTGYAWACVPVFAVFTAGILLQDAGVLTVNPRADLAIRLVCALLSLKAVICMGRVSR